MKSVFGIVLAALSLFGLAHQSSPDLPSTAAAVTFPKPAILAANAPAPAIVHVNIASSASVPAAPVAASKARHSTASPISAGIVLGTSTTDGVVTQSELQAAIQQASNSLRQLIYANAGTVGQGQYSSGGYRASGRRARLMPVDRL